MLELHVGAGQTYATINAAIAAAVSGDTIVVHAGTYTENVLINKSVTLTAVDGPSATTITNVNGANNATVAVANGINNVTIEGFTINGFDGASAAIETAAVYVLGAADQFHLLNNVIIANGEAALLSNWNAAITNAVIQGNTFDGKSFTVDTLVPGDISTQFVVDGVARQLVTFGQGYPGNPASNITFTGNTISGDSGLGAVGNNLVTIDANNSTIADNIFTGYAPDDRYVLRGRGSDVDVTGNDVSNPTTNSIYTPNNAAGTVSGNSFGGTADVDVINGTDGDDIFVATAGNDTYNGLGGSDTVDYSATTGGVVITATTAFATDTDTDNIGNDTLNSIENAIGGAGNDTFAGSSGVSNTFTGGAGNDIFSAGAGAGTDRFIYETAVAADSIATKGTNRLFVNGGAEGTDDLRNVEEIEFAGGVVVKVVNNNAAVYTVADALAVADTHGTDAGTVIHGSGLFDNDINIDQGGTDQKAVVAQIIEGTYGTLEVFANGEYTYTLKAAADALSSVASETLNYSVTDGTNITQSSLVITITGTNDNPIITGDVGDTADETDAVLSLGGKLDITDADTGEDAFVAGSNIAGTNGGTFTLASDGTWTYTAADAHNDLADGELFTDTFTAVSIDGTETDVTVTITGTNDGPVLGFSQGFATDTDGIVTGGGYGTITPVADGAYGTDYAMVTEAGSGPFTSFGGYSSEFVDGAEASIRVYLDTDWTLNEGFQYTVAANGSDGSHQRDFAFGVRSLGNGTLEVSTSTGASQSALTSTRPGSFNVSDSGWYTLEHVFNDVGGVLSVDLTLRDSNGLAVTSWTISAPEDLIGSAVGGNRYSWFTDISIPGGLAVDDYQLGDFAGSVTESGSTVSTSGVIPLSDLDLSDAHMVTITPADTDYFGVFDYALADTTNDGFGSLTWTFTGTSAQLDSLAEDQVVTQTYTITVDDGQGGVASQDVTVTITGTNDAPVITGDVGETADETDAVLSLGGKLDITDADSGENAFVADANIAGTDGGTFTLASDGTWTYTAADAHNDLAAGDIFTDTFTAVSIDGTETDVTITITGTNDGPQFNFLQDFSEGADGLGLGGSYGTLNIVDHFVDRSSNNITGDGDFAIITEGTGTPYGRGAYHYFDGAREGFVDGMAAEVKVYLDTGWNAGEGFEYSVSTNKQDGSFLRDFVFHVIKTSTGLYVGGDNNSSDSSSGGLNQNPNGKTLVNDSGWYTIQHVFGQTNGPNGPVLQVTMNLVDDNGDIVASIVRSNPLDLISTVAGGNNYGFFARIEVAGGIAIDDISLTGVDQATATEDAGADSAVSLTGHLLFNDIDGDSIPVGPLSFTPGPGSYIGTFAASVTEDPTGDSGGTIAWTFDANVDGLHEGETIIQTYDVTIDDGHGGTATQTVTVTITGTNDAPVITGDVGDTADETDAVLSLGGKLDITDADTGEDAFVAGSNIAGTNGGTFTLASDGTWTYTAADAHNDLADGEVFTDTFTAVSIDGTETDVTVTITGTNDAPVTGVLNVNVNEGDGVVTLDALANATDVDGDALTVIPGTLPPGVTFVGDGLTIDFQTGYAEGGINGQEGWFDASPSAPSANIVNLDGNFVLQVANNPTLSDFGGPYSPGLSVTAGELGSGADVNQIEYSFKFKPVSGTADGSRLELDIGNAEGTDRENFMVLEYFEDTLRIKQQSPGTVVNDWIETTLATDIDPTVFHTLRAVLTFGEGPNNDVIDYYLDNVLVGSGSTFENYRDWINPTHADVQDVNRLFFRTADFDTGPGDRQGFYIDDIKIGTPSFAFDANDAAYDHLAEGDSEIVTVNYQVSDGITTTDASATFTVYGTNDAPVAQDDAFEADEDGPEVNGAVIAIDADDDHDLTYSLVNPAPAGLTFNDDGTYSFDPSDAAYQSLADGEELEIIVDYKVVDDHDAEDFGKLVITITGTNDAPVVGISDLTGEVTEPVNLVSFPKATGTIHATDDGGSVTYSPLYTSNEYGSFSVNPFNGKWTFTLGAGSAVQALGDGDHVDTPFTVTVTDSQGLQTSVDVVITINGTNEQVNGTSGDNILLGSDYGDTINAGDGDDTVYGNAGKDLINGGNGDDALYGGSGNDAVNGGAGDDHIEGGSGDDTIDAGSGDDHVLGGSGIDTIVGGSGDDYLDGGNGDDFIYGDGGADYILGGSGRDDLSGGAGSDQLIGGSDDDILWGGAGADTLTGGDGIDEFRFVSVDDSSRTGARDTITDFDWGVDKIDLSQLTSNVATGDTGFVFLGLGDSARKIEAGYLKYFHEDGKTYLIGGTDNANDDLGELLVVFNGNITLTADSFTDGSLLATNPNIGTAADEIFYSGLGRDIFTSGDGHDIFVLNSVPQSRYGNENWDVITDFDSAKDKIDLSDMGTYHFLDNGSSSRNVAPDHLKWFEQAGNTFVVGDTTGDGLADFKIQLDDVGHNLTLDNFIL